MPTRNSVDGDLFVSGRVTAGALSGPLSRSYVSRSDDSFELLFHNFRVWDAYQTILPGAAAADDLGITTGAFATAAPYISTGDVKATSSTRRARTLFALPTNYIVQENLILSFQAGMMTTVADTSMTLDAELFAINADGTVAGADRITTGAQSINALGPATKNFTVDLSDGLVEPGDLLDLRISIAYVDAATATAVIGKITRIQFGIPIH